MSQIRTGQTKTMMINSKFPLVCFLIVIVSLLGAKVVPTTGKERTTTQSPASAFDRATATAPTGETGGRTPDKTSNKQRQTDASAEPVAFVSNGKINQQANSNNGRKCEYDKGQWDECEANDAQQKVMRLKLGGPECKQTKTIRRECKAKGEAGCKYARGEWSSVCQNGLRVRVDTLVGPVGGVRTNELARANHMKCKPQRRVTKDCRRTCHYTKSGWSECSNGFRTRVLTLADQVDIQSGEQGDEANGESAAGSSDKQPQTRASATNQTVNEICARQKLIRRKCAPGESKISGRSASSVQQQQQRENSQQQASGASSNLTPAQRRRLKQLQLKQQQQPQLPSPVMTTGAPQPPTTTTNKVRTTSGIDSSLTSGGGSSSTTTTAPTLAAKTTTLAKNRRR